MSFYLLAIFQKLVLSVAPRGVVFSRSQTHTRPDARRPFFICRKSNLILKVLSNAALPFKVPVCLLKTKWEVNLPEEREKNPPATPSHPDLKEGTRLTEALIIPSRTKKKKKSTCRRGEAPFPCDQPRDKCQAWWQPRRRQRQWSKEEEEEVEDGVADCAGRGTGGGAMHTSDTRRISLFPMHEITLSEERRIYGEEGGDQGEGLGYTRKRVV